MVFQDIFKIFRLHRLLYSISHKTGLFSLFSNRCYKKINTGGSFADLYKDDSHMLQVKLQVKFRILTIFNFCVEMGKLKKSTVLQNSKNLVFFYETSEKIRSSDIVVSIAYPYYSIYCTFRKSLFLQGFWTCFHYPNTIQQ